MEQPHAVGDRQQVGAVWQLRGQHGPSSLAWPCTLTQCPVAAGGITLQQMLCSCRFIAAAQDVEFSAVALADQVNTSKAWQYVYQNGPDSLFEGYGGQEPPGVLPAVGASCALA